MRKRFCSLLCALTLMFTLFAYLPQVVIRAGAANKFSGSFYMGYYDWDEVSGAKDYFVTFE